MKKLLLTIIIVFGFFLRTYAEEGQFRFGVELGWTPVEIEAEKTAQAIANASGSTVLTEYDKGAFVGRAFGEYGISSNLGVEVGYFQTSGAGATYKIGADSASETPTYMVLIFQQFLNLQKVFLVKLEYIHQL